MATMRLPTSAGDAAVDPAPLLGTRGGGRRLTRRPSLRGASRFLRWASSRRLMREPSVQVRETAAEQLEERQSDWAYSRPVVFLDIMWNLAFVSVAAGVLVLSRDERPSMPLRLWIVGYVLQCVLHIICVCIEYRRRHQPRGEVMDVEEGGSLSGRSSGLNSPREVEEAADAEQGRGEARTSIVKHLESANTMFSFVWWIIGFYWVSAGGQLLTRHAPQLYWFFTDLIYMNLDQLVFTLLSLIPALNLFCRLCIVFLAFDVFFVIFCVALACVVGVAVCCCLPCIIAILYAVADQQVGASEEEIRQLPKYQFRKVSESEKLVGEMAGSFGGMMIECGSDPPIEHVLSREDAECCICLSVYDDGVELRQLPCGHHFHSACIGKWLLINATCPLCKFNIIKSNNHGREEV